MEENNKAIKDVSAEEFKDLADKNDIIIIDCRTKPEFDAGHIKGAMLIDFYDPSFIDEISKLPKSKGYLIYCQTGSRSKAACGIMARAEMGNIYNMEYGVMEWYQKGFNLVK